MLKNLKIGTKLTGGFLLIAFIASVIGLAGLISVNVISKRLLQISHHEAVAIVSLLNISEAQSAIDGSENALLSANATEASRSAAYERIAFKWKIIDKNWKTYTSLHMDKEEEKIWNEFEPEWNRWVKDHHDYMAIVKAWEQNRTEENYRKVTHQALVTNAVSFTSSENFLNELIEVVQNSVDEHSLEADNAASRSRIVLIVVLLLGILTALTLGFTISRGISKPLSQVSDNIQNISKGDLSNRLQISSTDEIGILAREMNNLTETLNSLIVSDGGVVLQAAAERDLTKRMQKVYSGDFEKMKSNINTVIETLDQALAKVSEAVEQVSSASNQISGGSQSLAEGANEQASSLEEISSSLEEMSSMTKQNAENANQAKNLASETRQSASEGNEAMTRMSDAISKIKVSSDNTAKIIKTIDEIAFQTNLLALNAAVEAARAGEAGKGFAVVAEEVRNLAMRSAEAAKNTAIMIEESVKNADGGVRITDEVAKTLNQIVDRASKVNDLIAEIAAASNEQSLGIEQVNTAVAQMNKVTQSNAANSEEAAGAAEELNSQAWELAEMIKTFKSSNTTGNKQKTVKKPVQLTHAKSPRALPGAETSRGPNLSRRQQGTSSAAAQGSKAVRPEEIIPLNEDELKEF